MVAVSAHCAQARLTGITVNDDITQVLTAFWRYVPMKRHLLSILLMLAICLLASCTTQGTPQTKPTSTPPMASGDIRPPAVAGAFYPADPGQLRTMVDNLLSQAKKWPQEPIALIAPHAGYIYSGAVAAAAFKQIEGHTYDAIVVLGTNHQAPDFHRIAIWPSGAYSTPLGLMPIDSDLAESILAADPEHIVANRQVQLAEHSIEVELPFLLRVYGSHYDR